MIDRASGTFAYTVFFVFVGVMAFAQSSSFGPLVAETPFYDPKALNRLKQVFKERLDEDDLNTFREILEYRYDFEPVDGCPYSRADQCQDDEYFAARRTISFPIDGLPSKIQELVKQHEKEGCSSLKFPNSGLKSLHRGKLVFGGNIRARKFWCDDVLGKHKAGEANGSWLLTVPLVRRAPSEIILIPKEGEVSDVGQLKFGKSISWHDIHDNKILGFIDTDTFFGKIFSDIFIEFDLSPIKIVLTWFGEATPKEALAELSKKIEESYSATYDLATAFGRPTEEYLSVIGLRDPTNVFPFYVDHNRSGFYAENLHGSQIQFKVIQVSYLPREILKIQHSFGFAQDIELIKSWSKEDKNRTISDGETLWDVSKDELGRGDLFHLLAAFNPQLSDVNRIEAGQVIVIPALWKIVEQQQLDNIVNSGDTYWIRYIESGSNENWAVWLKENSDGIRSPDKIFPGQVFESY